MINFEGDILEDQQATINLDNRSFNYGDGLFETIRVINGKIMFWEDHYFRLMASMRIMRMEIPMEFSPEFLEEQILILIEKNNLSQKPVKVKINVFRKSGGLYKPTTREIGYSIRTYELNNSFYILNENNYEVELFKDHYVNSGLLATLKSTAKQINILGSIFAEENDYDNCLLVNENKSVVEALNGNLFVVKGNVIKTAPIKDGCLNGITRKKLIEIIKKLDDFTLEETSISPFELQKADELFITNVIAGIQPITKYRKKNFTNTVAKQLLAKLNTTARLG
ncbi:branched-chain amino acid aminotransferase [Mesonia phycicola]|uniref:branched-chain-amino-acid transaminase n=1 Tax=Mesonia phycicola TaxID=579105 RepID=A0A1M6DRB1_9FLAO|nr:aminotransferase class IV [Mesonia phycicola]SHI75796.1 branched-chain amino acid aminotransferase [Mesonia phycicola]